jgi:hypothetical protein
VLLTIVFPECRPGKLVGEKPADRRVDDQALDRIVLWGYFRD